MWSLCTRISQSCACVFHHVFMSMHFLPRVSAHEYFTMWSLRTRISQLCHANANSPCVPEHAFFSHVFSAHAYISSVSTQAYFAMWFCASVHTSLITSCFCSSVLYKVKVLPRKSSNFYAAHCSSHVNFTRWFSSCGLHHVVLFMWTSPRGFSHVDFIAWLCSCWLSTWFCSCRLHPVVLSICTWPRASVLNIVPRSFPPIKCLPAGEDYPGQPEPFCSEEWGPSDKGGGARRLLYTGNHINHFIYPSV